MSDRSLEQALAWRRAGRRVALATVVSTWGSAPRRPGSRMAVNDNGDFEGSVSGGCVEGAVVEEALEVMRTGKAKLLDIGVSNSRAWEVGLACGGKLEIFIEPIA